MDINLLFYKSRVTLLDYLTRRGFDTAELMQFSKNEIEAMVKKETMDFMVSTLPETQPSRKIYVKYMPYKQSLTTGIVSNIIDDLFDGEAKVSELEPEVSLDRKTDSVIIVGSENFNDKMKAFVASLFETQGIYISIFSIHSLQYNILEHKLQPEVERILTAEELESLKKEYNFLDAKTQLPEISRFDPLAMSIFLRPGEVVKFMRKSRTAITTPYYRYCISAWFCLILLELAFPQI